MGNEASKSSPIAEYLMNVWNRASSEVLDASKEKAMDAVMEMRRNSRPFELKNSEIPNLTDEELIFSVMEWMRSKITDWFDPYKDLELLPKPCQNVYSCQTVANEIGNGGIVQLVFNSRMKDAEMSVEGFISLGTPKLSNVMEKAVSIYQENKQHIDEYKIIPNGYIDLCNEKLFDELEKRFIDEICSVDIPSYIRANAKHFGDEHTP